MKNTIQTLTLALAALFSTLPAAYAQTALVQTTLSAAADSSTHYVTLASGTSFLRGDVGYIDRELVVFEPVGIAPPATSGAIRVYVRRGTAGTKATGHISGAVVLFGPPQAFVAYEPSGSCTNGEGLFQYSPVVNVNTGNQWLCSTVTGQVVPGFGNHAAPRGPTTAVASAAGEITPSGPLFHITGTDAITGFNIPVGCNADGGCSFTVIADGVFSWTTANNIALASSTVVASKTYTFTYDPDTKKFYPSTQ